MRIWEEEARPERQFRLRDGRTLTVHHPGHLNVSDGPDYLDAHLRIEGRDLRGDVELHLRPEQWTHHGHHLDPRYTLVALHVCLYPPRGPMPGPPLLVLAGQLLRPLRSRWSDVLTAGPRPGRHCSGMLGQLPDTVLTAALVLAAEERFTRKTNRAEQRLSALRALRVPLPGRQLLFELLARGLGYGGNEHGTQRLAESILLRRFRECDPGRALRLFGIAAGLESPSPGDPVLPVMSAATWNRKSVKPANRIERVLPRLAAAAVALASERWWTDLRAASARVAGAGSTEGLVRVFRFDEAAPPARAVGLERARELAVNSFAPWCALCGAGEGLPDPGILAARMFHHLPDAASNRATRSFDVELAGRIPRTSGVQQGMIELHAGYCERGLCGACLIGAASDRLS